jgi:hypothetical protein
MKQEKRAPGAGEVSGRPAVTGTARIGGDAERRADLAQAGVVAEAAAGGDLGRAVAGCQPAAGMAESKRAGKKPAR